MDPLYIARSLEETLQSLSAVLPSITRDPFRSSSSNAVHFTGDHVRQTL